MSNLLVLDLAGLDPGLDLVPVALQLLDLLLEVGLELLLLVGILGVVDLPEPRGQRAEKLGENRTIGVWGERGVPCSRCCRRRRRPPGPS
jgi:hypothetical protein